MTEKTILVSIEINNVTKPVGRLYCRSNKGRESASFEYDKTWLTDPDKFSLEPALSLTKGQFQTAAEQRIFGAFGDSAPDRWGRQLMKHAEAARSREKKEAAKTLQEIDFLLGVNDKTRLGALRFALDNAPDIYLADDKEPIPPLMQLDKLLAASQNILADKEKEQDLKLLLNPGSSLGGARAKATITDKEELYIAKFPQKNDMHNIILWEYTALELAKEAHIAVSDYKYVPVTMRSTKYDILLLKRFDRIKQRRIPFLSAMSMLGARDNEDGHSYLEIADALRQYGATPQVDLEELWRRIIFTILVSNTDDHLRNHGFLYSHSGRGWRLSPAYDINPTPYSRILSTAITASGERTASLDLAFEAADYFRIEKERQNAILREVSSATQKWQELAKKNGMSQKDIDYMTSAFEHEDSEKAAKIRGRDTSRS